MKKVIMMLLLVMMLMLCACGNQSIEGLKEHTQLKATEGLEYEARNGSYVVTGYHGSEVHIVIPDLVPGAGNTYDFYEVPQPATQTQKEVSADGLEFEEIPSHDEQGGSGGQSVLPEDIEINNNNSIDNSEINNANNPEVKEEICKPKVKEIVISRPVAEGKNRPKTIQKAEFVF